MVQGQTAQKIFAFDEGDVWRHPGNSLTFKVVTFPHFGLQSAGLELDRVSDREQFKALRHCVDVASIFCT